MVAIYLHLEQDYYKPDLMLPDNPDNPTKWLSTRMLQPGKQNNYFFSISEKKYYAHDQLRNTFKPEVQITGVFGSNKDQLIEDGNAALFQGLKKLNYLPAM
jgi:hypothetical protein